MTPADLVLSKLEGVRPNGTGSSFVARCPAHEDRNPSLHVSTGDEGQALLRCFAGCSTTDIVKAIGLTMANLFPERERAEYRQPTPTPGPSRHCTVEALATAKGLPVAFLQARGFEDRPDGVLIPYKLEDGSPAPRQRLRTALVAKEGSRWLPGEGSPVPYGLDRLEEIQERGFLILVEGETDALTCWHHGYPALGIPGASMAKTIQAEHIHALETVFVWQEPDKGGETFAASAPARLREIGFKGAVRILKIDGTKDANDLHRKDPAAFDKAIAAAMDAARGVTPGSAPARPIFPRSAAQYITDEIPEPPAIIEGILPAEAVLLLYATEKTGKSFLLLQLAVALASGGDFLGFITHGTHRVLFLSPEGSDASLKKRLLASLPHMGGIEDEVLERLFLVSTLGSVKLDTPEGEAIIRQWATDVQANVVILDSVFRFIGTGEENSHSDARLFQDALDRLKASGLTVIVSHHSRKQGDSDRGTAEIRGAGWGQYVDAILKLSKKKEGASSRYSLTFTLRHYEEPADIELIRNGPLFALAGQEDWTLPPSTIREVVEAEGGRVEGQAAIHKLVQGIMQGVSLRTVQRSIQAAEQAGLIYSAKREGRGQGRVYCIEGGTI